MAHHGGPGQKRESVWAYPRPPRVEPCLRRARVLHGGLVVADSRRAMRVLETSHPPGIYLPPDDVDLALLEPEGFTTLCEYKGRASYWSLAVPGSLRVARAAWSYPDPQPGYEAVAGYLSFYPDRVERCLLDDETVTPQQGGFYGGWITAEVEGPFKSGPGTLGW